MTISNPASDMVIFLFEKKKVSWLFLLVDNSTGLCYSMSLLKLQQVERGATLYKRFEKFTVLINGINRNIRKIKNQEMAEYNLRSSHISCLYYLYQSEGLTATDLCERCGEDKATISRSLDYLEKNGYLICEAKSAKRYKSPFILTGKGARIAEKIADKVAYFIEQVSVDLSEEERLQFYHSLSLISKNLDNIVNKKV